MENTLKLKVRKLIFCRPEKKNAISLETYEAITRILTEDANNDDVLITIISGKGDYFSSGNDFESSLKHHDVDKIAIVENMINAFINYPKILIAVVNGPAIGIAATFITLCDIIYCSDKATFEIPFVRLGLSLEGCSSLLYPKLLGKNKASEMLYLNHVLTAAEAYNLGFVAKIIPHDKLEEFITSLYKFSNLPVRTVITNKKLFSRWSKSELLECSAHETKVLRETSESDEFFEALTSFFERKSKL